MGFGRKKGQPNFSTILTWNCVCLGQVFLQLSHDVKREQVMLNYGLLVYYSVFLMNSDLD